MVPSKNFHSRGFQLWVQVEKGRRKGAWHGKVGVPELSWTAGSRSGSGCPKLLVRRTGWCDPEPRGARFGRGHLISPFPFRGSGGRTIFRYTCPKMSPPTASPMEKDHPAPFQGHRVQKSGPSASSKLCKAAGCFAGKLAGSLHPGQALLKLHLIQRLDRCPGKQDRTFFPSKELSGI